MPAPKNPKSSNMSKKEMDECVTLRSQGWTFDALAKKYSRHWKTISRVMERRGGQTGRKLYHEDAGKVVAPEYNSWRAMKKRCYQESDKDYHNYGGRGITVCDRWLNSYKDFLEDMGRKPSPQHTIERLENDLGYFLDNCVWATPQQQGHNKRASLRIMVDGRLRSLPEACLLKSAKRHRIYERLKAGWSVEEAFSKPPRSIHRGK